MRSFTLSVGISLLVGTSISDQAWSSDRLTQAGEQKASPTSRLFRAGASAVDIAPATFPVLVNGGFLQSQAAGIKDPVQAKCLVLDDGASRLAIVVVDTCMMPRELIDRAKSVAQQKTGIRMDRMLISATHAHSAPAAMGALGCPADENYVKILPGLIAESIDRAAHNLEPARVGWSAIDDHLHTHCRRWIRRPDRMLNDPFGEQTVRANMHPGYQNPDVIAPSGPVDPELIVLSVQSRSGRPIAALANYSMHYYGAAPVSADYFGRFAVDFAKRASAQATEPPFIAIMSQGTSGDQMWMDYGAPRNEPGLDVYASGVARVADQAYQSIPYLDWVPLAMAETTLVLDRRTPDPKRLEWAKAIVNEMNTRGGSTGKLTMPTSQPEVYAREAIYLHEEPRRELKLQAIRIGDLGITAIPNEVFAITGLKIKTQSPFNTTMNIELANGSEGYIPPPEQHRLGGYTTWPARTAGLEVQAEPKIVASILNLLEQVAEKPRRSNPLHRFPYTEAVLASRPFAYWRLDDIEISAAVDSSGNTRSASYEGGVALYLPGAPLAGASIGKSINRAVHLAGGRLEAAIDGPGDTYTAELWFWIGLPTDVRPITGDLLSIGTRTSTSAIEIDLSIAGTSGAPGCLSFSSKTPGKALSGKTKIAPQTWHHVALVQKPAHVDIYLDGNPRPEISGKVPSAANVRLDSLSIGGRDDGLASFEGKIDEVALFDRALTAAEITGHFQASRNVVEIKPAQDQ